MSNEPEQKPLSRQRRWQLKKEAEGKCVTCGGGPLLSSRYCAKHLQATRERNRDRVGCNPWEPGGRGRPYHSMNTEPPTIERCLELADTFCKPESWGTDFWRAPMATLAAEVRKLREEVSRLEDKCEAMHYECLDRSIPYE